MSLWCLVRQLDHQKSTQVVRKRRDALTFATAATACSKVSADPPACLMHWLSLRLFLDDCLYSEGPAFSCLELGLKKSLRLHHLPLHLAPVHVPNFQTLIKPKCKCQILQPSKLMACGLGHLGPTTSIVAISKTLAILSSPFTQFPLATLELVGYERFTDLEPETKLGPFPV